jgi:hypothetical protein
MEAALNETLSVNFSNDAVQTFVDEFRNLEKREAAQRIYIKVRDHFLYDPFHLDLRPEALRASEIFQKKRAWCVEKALVMVAASRALGIPARFGFATVVNHLGIDSLTHYLGRAEITFHGYAVLFVDNHWVRCTPAFDRRVCRLSGVAPLEWDGKHDSLFQPMVNGKKYMEYLEYIGEFDEIPFKLMHQKMQEFYPHLFLEQIETDKFSFHFDAGMFTDES